MTKISAIVITFNEEDNICECLNSLKFCDEIVVIDSKSTDKTVKIASEFTKNIIITENIHYSDKKNIGIQNSNSEWILSIDADERVTPELKEEIVSTIKSNPTFNSYYLKKKSYFINKFIRHCGWYPDYVLRLFKKSSKVKFSDERVHEKLLTDEKSGKLNNDLLHYTDKTFEHYIDKLNNYTSLSADEMITKNQSSGISDIIFRPVFTFIKMYFLKLGFLDGYEGLVLCTLSGVHVFVKYSKHFLLTHKL